MRECHWGIETLDQFIHPLHPPILAPPPPAPAILHVTHLIPPPEPMPGPTPEPKHTPGQKPEQKAY